MATGEIPDFTEIKEALALKPGDTLVLRYDRLTEFEHDRIMAYLQWNAPGIKFLVVEASQMAKIEGATS